MGEGSPPGSDNSGVIPNYRDFLPSTGSFQRQTHELLNQPGNWLSATASNVRNDLSSEVLPLASFLHNPGQFAAAETTRQGRELLGNWRSQLTGLAEQPFALTQDGNITGQANVAGRSLSITGREPGYGFSGRLFQQPGSPLGAAGDLSVTGNNFGLNVRNFSGASFPQYDFHGQSRGPGWIFETAPLFQLSADSHSAAMNVQAGNNRLSFGIEGSDAMTAPLAFRLAGDNHDTGTSLSLLTDGRHLSEFHVGQNLGPVRLGYEGNLRTENSFSAGVSTNIFDCHASSNGRDIFGATVSGQIWPGARLGATIQQEHGHPNYGLTLTIGGSNQSD